MMLPATQAQADAEVVDPDPRPPTAQVLVLGTVHLREMPEPFQPSSLDGLLEKLEMFRPDIIAIEALSGEECYVAARFPEKYGVNYCAPNDLVQSATGLDVPAAMAEVEQTLADWPASPSFAQRRRLASLFLAAGDIASAYVQWLQLPESERREGEGLNTALVDILVRTGARNNENYQLAARLAARLALERVHPINDHTGDRVKVSDVKAFVQSVEAAWKAGRAELDARRDHEQVLKSASDLLPLYRLVNDPEHLRILADVNVGATMRAENANHYPRIWVAGWETRNLRMVANIRESFRERPDARVLVIVGASHKPWFDDWLGQLQGVSMVDVPELLGE